MVATAAVTPSNRPMKKKTGALRRALSTTRPSTSGTTTAAANRSPRPRNSIPDGPWPALPRSPAGDIPPESLPDSPTDEEHAHGTAEWDRDPPLRRAQALAQRGRQQDDHEHDGDGQDAPVAEDGQADRAQDAGRAVEEDARLALRQPEAEELVVQVLAVRLRDPVAVAAAADDGERGVGDGDAQRQQRHRDGGGDGDLRDADDGQQRERQPQEVGAGVPHE